MCLLPGESYALPYLFDSDKLGSFNQECPTKRVKAREATRRAPFTEYLLLECLRRWGSPHLMPHILSVSYDAMLKTRQLMLESCGYTVTSAEGFVEAMRRCVAGNYDLLIIGHSIPHTDKKALIEEMRGHCHAPVLALLRPGELELLNEATKSIDAANPKLLLDTVAQLLSPTQTTPD